MPQPITEQRNALTITSIIEWLYTVLEYVETNALSLAQLFAALITAAATFALWRVTRVLAAETTVLAKMTAQPFVVCWLESSSASSIALNLTLRNTGNATAFDIQLRLSSALPMPSGEASDNPSETTFATSMLPPGQALKTQGVMGRDLHDQVYRAQISWTTRPGEHEREVLEYSFEPKDGFRGGWNVKGVHHIAEELEKIRRQLPKQ